MTCTWRMSVAGWGQSYQVSDVKPEGVNDPRNTFVIGARDGWSKSSQVSGVKAGWSKSSQDWVASEPDGVNLPRIEWLQSRIE